MHALTHIHELLHFFLDIQDTESSYSIYNQLDNQ
jgi:hypothetical protein